jgi:hypothetical protein
MIEIGANGGSIARIDRAATTAISPGARGVMAPDSP